MPPKVQEAVEVEPTFVFERDRMIKKFNDDNFVLRQKIQPIDVPRQPSKDPAKKLKERLDTYNNLRKMKTDYKNYIRKYGEPPFSVNLPC
jgi:hypothetical protein